VRADRGGEPHVQCFGVRERGGTEVVGPRTLFRLASVSKIVTGLAAAVAVQEGLLDLDRPVTRYLPALRLRSRFSGHDDTEETERITARHLLSHMAGLPRQARVGNGVRDWEGHIRSIGDSWLRFPVGRRMGYSDIGPDLLGRVLEVVSGEAFPAFVHRAILEPLRMEDATFDPAEADGHDRAHGSVGGRSAPTSGMVPAGSLHASGRDVGRLLRFVLEGGRADGRRVLSSALLEDLATVPCPGVGQTEGYALGQRLQTTVWGGRARGHAGSGYGFLTDLWWLPDSGVGGGVLTSSQDHDLRGRVIWDLLEPGGAVLTSARPRADVTLTDAAPPHEVRGRYYDPIYGALVVEARAGVLGIAGPSFRSLRFDGTGDAEVEAPPPAIRRRRRRDTVTRPARP
jgi:CubicO group peptidase (beta-lactamase class C family)